MADPMVFNMSMADRGALWSLWQSSIVESPCRLLRFWSKVLPSSVNNYSLFEKQLLVLYGVLVEIKLLNLDHQIIMQPSLPTINWTWFDPPNHKIDAQEVFIIKWKWYEYHEDPAGSESTNKLHEKVAKVPMASTPTSFSLPQSAHMAHAEFPMINW